MQFSFSRKIYKFGILWPYAQLFSKVHQRWIHMTEWIIPLNCFYEFIIKCNKNYPSNCPKVTYCMSILFLYTQAICHLVAMVLICKIIRSKKGRTEKENDFDWVTHLLTTESLDHGSAGWLSPQLRVSCCICATSLTGHFPVWSKSILGRNCMCYSPGVPREHPQMLASDYGCICPRLLELWNYLLH